MTERNLTKQKLKGELDEIRAEVKMLKAKAAQTTTEQRIKFDRYLETLEEKRNEVGESLESLKESGDDAVDDIKAGLKEAWQRLAIAKQAAEARFH